MRRLWNKVRVLLSLFHFALFEEGGENMAVIYATLIIKGKRAFISVPDAIKEQVKEVLIDLEAGQLAE